MSGPLTRDVLRLHLRLGAPPTGRGHEYIGLALDLGVTPLDVLIGGAIAIGVVWGATRHLPSHPESATDRVDVARTARAIR